jgi:cytochrome c oxidase cbb3-type subunit 3
VRRSIVSASILVVLALFVGSLAAAEKSAKGDPVKGKEVYKKTCIICHNPDGSGGKKLTPAGNASRDFRDPAFWAGKTDDQIRKTINEGVPKSGMTAWKGVLKPQQIEDVMAYVKTFAKKEPAKESAPKESAAKESAAK